MLWQSQDTRDVMGEEGGADKLCLSLQGWE